VLTAGCCSKPSTNNKPRLKQVNEIAKDWNAIERKLAKKENRHPDLIDDPLATQPYGTLDQLEKGLMNIQRRGAGVYIPFNLMRADGVLSLKFCISAASSGRTIKTAARSRSSRQ
jgi:hypothetical protein